ncbi:beta-ketoacyl synthase N-terminal-like domain-containing protein [Sciscionella sediminilitoris]|uniref:beta-ketoacyl synthase N-terminal-like domain-containing protein n=1 Tax=Sciscionella sediminilitoris TaxID=1445613 RepID=UPI0004DF3382|nr:beta-ketoacyl synthase N-terminal-like domain-containing protein [Sciscionella sp. SE31]
MNLLTAAQPVLPGIADCAGLLREPRNAEPVDPAAVLGKKGLRYKDRATQLGLVAAKLVLTEANLLDGEGRCTDPGMGVVVSSNFGNVDTVCRVANTIAEETTRGVSPMDTANASSNVIASEIAIRFRLRGPNLMLCNGSTSGADAMRWADSLVRAGRAARMLVIGVEPDNPVVRELSGNTRVLDGGAGVLLESPDAARNRGVTGKAVLRRCVRAADPAGCARELGAEPALRLGSGESAPFDLDARLGASSGALGVLQCAASIGWFSDGGRGSVHAISGSVAADATAGLLIGGADE